MYNIIVNNFVHFYLCIKFFLQVAKKYPYFAPAASSQSFNVTISERGYRVLNRLIWPYMIILCEAPKTLG